MVVICLVHGQKTAGLVRKVAEYVTENVEVEEYGPQYYSQRGEDCPPRLDSNLIEYLNDMEEYAYVYTKDQEWVCFKNQYDDAPVKLAIPTGALCLRADTIAGTLTQIPALNHFARCPLIDHSAL